MGNFQSYRNAKVHRTNADLSRLLGSVDFPGVGRSGSGPTVSYLAGRIGGDYQSDSGQPVLVGHLHLALTLKTAGAVSPVVPVASTMLTVGSDSRSADMPIFWILWIWWL